MHGINLETVRRAAGCTHALRLSEMDGRVTIHHYGDRLLRDLALDPPPPDGGTYTGLVLVAVRRFHREDAAGRRA